MKNKLLKVIENRIEEFAKIHHHYEADELIKAKGAINRLIPPSSFDYLESELEKVKEEKNSLMVDFAKWCYEEIEEGYTFSLEDAESMVNEFLTQTKN